MNTGQEEGDVTGAHGAFKVQDENFQENIQINNKLTSLALMA